MKNTGKVIGGIAVGFLILSGLFFYANRPAVVASNFKQPQEITGSIEAEEVDVNIKIPGRLLKIMVEEGQEVKEGEILASLEAEDLEAKQARAKAALDAAVAQYHKAKNGARPQQLAQAKDLTDQAKAGYELAQATYNRMKQLFTEGVLAQQKLDVAATELEVARTRYNSAKEQYNMVSEGAQKEDIESAAALVSQAQAAYDEVMSYLHDANIKAPLSGIITSKSVSAGELISTGMPVVTITNLNSTWVNVKVRETALQQFQVGKTVPLEINGVPGKAYHGKVTYIGAKPSYATERAYQEKGEKDLVAFEVRIKLENKDLKLRPGMTAVVRVK